eukprot:4588957-Amphidinium_carterae.1
MPLASPIPILGSALRAPQSLSARVTNSHLVAASTVIHTGLPPPGREEKARQLKEFSLQDGRFSIS